MSYDYDYDDDAAPAPIIPDRRFENIHLLSTSTGRERQHRKVKPDPSTTHENSADLVNFLEYLKDKEPAIQDRDPFELKHDYSFGAANNLLANPDKSHLVKTPLNLLRPFSRRSLQRKPSGHILRRKRSRFVSKVSGNKSHDGSSTRCRHAPIVIDEEELKRAYQLEASSRGSRLDMGERRSESNDVHCGSLCEEDIDFLDPSILLDVDSGLAGMTCSDTQSTLSWPTDPSRSSTQGHSPVKVVVSDGMSLDPSILEEIGEEFVTGVSTRCTPDRFALAYPSSPLERDLKNTKNWKVVSPHTTRAQKGDRNQSRGGTPVTLASNLEEHGSNSKRGTSTGDASPTKEDSQMWDTLPDARPSVPLAPAPLKVKSKTPSICPKACYQPGVRPEIACASIVDQLTKTKNDATPITARSCSPKYSLRKSADPGPAPKRALPSLPEQRRNEDSAPPKKGHCMTSPSDTDSPASQVSFRTALDTKSEAHQCTSCERNPKSQASSLKHSSSMLGRAPQSRRSSTETSKSQRKFREDQVRWQKESDIHAYYGCRATTTKNNEPQNPQTTESAAPQTQISENTKISESDSQSCSNPSIASSAMADEPISSSIYSSRSAQSTRTGKSNSNKHTSRTTPNPASYSTTTSNSMSRIMLIVEQNPITGTYRTGGSSPTSFVIKTPHHPSTSTSTTTTTSSSLISSSSSSSSSSQLQSQPRSTKLDLQQQPLHPTTHKFTSQTQQQQQQYLASPFSFPSPPYSSTANGRVPTNPHPQPSLNALALETRELQERMTLLSERLNEALSDR
ncbi:MAG: hypothetical protein M1834_005387 [Cirrosporium novae-zelandiae]|nr:MAG: hypothetical protein M1834_005387 [Cirrosporium novae-zelandiae]